jgi:hypothetical protein
VATYWEASPKAFYNDTRGVDLKPPADGKDKAAAEAGKA